MAMITCTKCGNQINGDEAFCPYCGISIQSMNDQPEAPQSAPQPQAPQSAPQPQAPQSAPQSRAYQSAPQPWAYQSAPQPQVPPVYANPTYTPPVYAPQPRMSDERYVGKTGKGMGWIVFMRVILWIIFAGIIVSGVVMGLRMFDYDEVLAIAYILGGVFSAFITVAAGMILLNNATNLRSIATNTAKTVELLQDIRRR